ncbi:MAG: nuclear transport factor 2 family protein [Microbacteriaceae bacterium]
MTLTLAELIDRAEIQDALHRYAQAQDQDRWDLYDTVFTDDAEVELVGLPLGTVPAVEFGRFLRVDFGATRLSGQHLIGNTLIELLGDTARSVSEVLHSTLQRTGTPNELTLSEGTSLYADSWRRTGAGWCIAHRIITQKHVEERVVSYDPAFIAAIEAGAARDLSVAGPDAAGPDAQGPYTRGPHTAEREGR